MSFRPPDPNPVIGDVRQFDRKSGSHLERLIFNNRWIVLVACVVATILLAIASFHLRLNASFDKMLPKHQQYIVNYLRHERDLKDFGNAIRIAVETRNGTTRRRPICHEIAMDPGNAVVRGDRRRTGWWSGNSRGLRRQQPRHCYSQGKC